MTCLFTILSTIEQPQLTHSPVIFCVQILSPLDFRGILPHHPLRKSLSWEILAI